MKHIRLVYTYERDVWIVFFNEIQLFNGKANNCAFSTVSVFYELQTSN